jgi:K(+)-stimulated pyrophosphate-energized sodium pump
MFIGICIPFLISSITMTAVGDAAFEMINEIRRQFREITGLMEGTADPDSEKCVEIATKAALKKMMLPGVIAGSDASGCRIWFGCYGFRWNACRRSF